MTRRNQDGIGSAREFWGEFPMKDKNKGLRLRKESFQINNMIKEREERTIDITAIEKNHKRIPQIVIC